MKLFARIEKKHVMFPNLGTPPPDALQNGGAGIFSEKARQNGHSGPQSVPSGGGPHFPGGAAGGQNAHAGGVGRQRPLDMQDRCDFKTIQKTCSLFGLDLVSFLSIILPVNLISVIYYKGDFVSP
jgi:hypothetical protein